MNLKRNYFLIGSILGLFLAVVVGFLVMGESFFLLFRSEDKYQGTFPIVVGVFATIVAALIFDRKIFLPSFLKSALVLPAIIFFIGSLSGCLVSFMINGHFQNFFDWLVKPLFWLMAVGLPLAILLGVVYFLAAKKLK